MSEVVHANIFFFITGIAVIIVSAILCVVLFHAIHVLKSVRRIVDRIEAETEVIAEDIQHVREFFTEEGFLARLVATLMGRKAQRESRGSRAKTSRRSAELSIKDDE